MLKIGLTGGIGSGKSLAARIFSILGIPVYNADAEAKRLMGQDDRLLMKLRQAFGPEVIGEKGPDRRALARIIFNDPLAMELVNSLVHPAVASDFRAWLENQSSPYIIKEAAIIFETGGHRHLDTVILVTAPEQVRLQRVMKRDGETEMNVRRRMENQWPDEKKIPLAGLVLNNDGMSPLLPAIIELDRKLRKGQLPGKIKTRINN
jgi:dephospho-CoA kinase